MSRVSVVRITTADTKKTYEFDGKKDNLQLWEVSLQIRCVDDWGRSSSGSRHTEGQVYLERQTLVNAGLLPVAAQDKEPTPEEKRTVEDLILELLEHVGVFPEF